MQPITRETITDRRQPAIRWSAVLAGTSVAIGLCSVFQLIGIGAGLSALDPEDVTSARRTALGINAFTVISPLLATLVGSYIAAKLANTYDRRVAGAHGLVVWGLTAISGLIATLWMANIATMSAVHVDAAHRGHPMGGDVSATTVPGGDDLAREAQDALVPINQSLQVQGKSQIRPRQLIAAAREATVDGTLDRAKFVETLDDKTDLSRDEAAEVATQLGPRAEKLAQMPAATPGQYDAIAAAKHAGRSLLALALSILLSIGTAILGALLALHKLKDRGRGSREREVQAEAFPPTTTTPGV